MSDAAPAPPPEAVPDDGADAAPTPEEPKELSTEQKKLLEAKVMVLKAGKDSGFVEYAYLAPKHLKKQFKDICDDTIDKQCEYWLKSFVKEFEGRVPEILELAEEFKAYLPDEEDASKATHIDAFQAHVFLERKGTPFTVLELRAMMREICADDNNVAKFSFVEYLAWSYQKTLKEIFMVKPGNLEPLLQGLYQAMHDYQESKAQHDAKTEEIKEEIEKSEAEHLVVKGRVGNFALKEVLTRGATKRQRDAVYHKYKQKKAQAAYDKRKAEELAAKKAIDAEERKASRARMAARMGAKEPS
jgi:hypothetical protein